MKRIIMAILRRLTLLVCFFLPLDNTKVVFSSYYGKGYGDNPKYITNELLKRNNNYKLVWLVTDEVNPKSFPDGVILAEKNSLKGIYHITTAKIWVDNCRKSYYYKKKNQFYMQTWHGFALKRIEKDVANNLSAGYVNNAIKDSKAIDLIISDSEFMTSIYKSAFWYDGEIVKFGSPRNDIIIQKNNQELCKAKVREYYKIPAESKILLYAPTFRANRSLEPYKIDFDHVSEACREMFSANFVSLVRLHPNISKKSNELNYKWNQNLIDASSFDDMQILLSAADVVITDYSSLMFDFALANKPCFLFATDIEDYKKDRNFYFKFEELPFSISTSNNELVQAISAFEKDTYNQKVDAFFERVGMEREGTASQKCADFIDKICFGKGSLK